MLELEQLLPGIQNTQGLCLARYTYTTQDLKHIVTLIPIEGLEQGLRYSVYRVWMDALDRAASRDGLHRCYVHIRPGALEAHYTAIASKQTPTNLSVFVFKVGGDDV